MNLRQLFLSHVAQTSPSPIALQIERAEGVYLFDDQGKSYLDLIGGISVANLGHGRKEIVAAVKEQAEKYLHIMVYGELIQGPQVAYAAALVKLLPDPLSSVYFTNSGAEAMEGAIKLARRVTGRPEIIACNNSYHGATTGALALMGDEYWRNAFRPLMPGIWHYDYNSDALIDAVSERTAAVVIEPIQAEAGVMVPGVSWMKALEARCRQTGTLLIVDEIQCGFGRTGTMWGFEHWGITPDIVLLGKALGGGMPLGAFVASGDHMNKLTVNPELGHITTFGGHPVSCAAGLAALEVLLREQIKESVQEKEALFLERLHHPMIRSVSAKGLLMAVRLGGAALVTEVLRRCLEKGLFSDWFLFAPDCIRVAPPLTISGREINLACDILLEALDNVS